MPASLLYNCQRSLRYKSALIFLILIGVFSSCSHGPKRTTPELSQYQGKKVALVDVDGESTARSVVEVALINQLTQKGTFILVAKQDVDTAKTDYCQDPTNLRGIAQRAGADYALKAKVLTFDATENQGYSEEKYEDSQLAEEQGDDAKDATRVYKVKSMTAKVKVELTFTDVKTGETRSAPAEADDRVTSDARNEAIHLPPRLRFLEKVSNEAFAKFFDQYN